MLSILLVGSGNQIIKSFINILRERSKEEYAIWYTIYDNYKVQYYKDIYGENAKEIFFDIRYYEEGRLYFVPPVNFDCVVVSAWYGTGGKNIYDKRIQQKNVLALYSLLTRVKSKKIVLIGSQAEYGIKSKIVNELTVQEPYTEYGKAKLLLYNKLSEYCVRKDINLIELRIHSCYGVEDDERKVLYKVIHDLVIKKTVNMKSDCSQLWDFVFYTDVAEAVYKSVTMDIEDGIYNISYEENRSLKEYFEIVQKVIGGTIIFGSEVDRDAPNFIFKSDKFRKNAKWSPKVNFAMGVRTIREQLTKMKKSGEV